MKKNSTKPRPLSMTDNVNVSSLVGLIDEALEQLAIAAGTFAIADGGGADDLGNPYEDASDDRERFNIAVAHVAASLRCIKRDLSAAR